jgi:hypothetical protein
MLKFVVLSIGFARPGTILPVIREITLVEMVWKHNFRIKSGMCKISFVIMYIAAVFITVYSLFKK